MKTLRNILITTIALLGVATVASADHRDRGPRFDRGERLQAVAHQLENRAERLYDLAERQSHHRDRAEARALDALYEFKREARHFHRQVERYTIEPYHVKSDFRELRRAYHRAVGSLDLLHARGHVRREADRVGDVMHELQVEMARFDVAARRGGRFYRDRPSWTFRWAWSTRRR